MLRRPVSVLSVRTARARGSAQEGAGEGGAELGEGGVFGTLAEATEGAATCKFAEGTVQDGEELLSYGDVLGWDD
jgi:hypothetical protein